MRTQRTRTVICLPKAPRDEGQKQEDSKALLSESPDFDWEIYILNQAPHNASGSGQKTRVTPCATQQWSLKVTFKH
ncbi:hypothetical protein NDU88_000957 [Pleurodeles waltl]|uniref:Uncharacterized protein n=1 Tax=Pleurodeles waltl TaxID=8319 RepID=A0AAV7P5L7_PLEWA|nr:hypothetical protein NDU88_000957 [Pleurodeles waltl]